MGVDEPQVVQTIVTLLGVGLGVFGFLCFFAGMVDKRIEPLGTSKDIGEIDDQDLFAIATGSEEYLAAHATLSSVKRKKKRKTQPSQPESPNDKLLTDCVGALVGLGTGRGEARRVATKLLVSSPHITTIDSFVREVFKRENS